MLRENDLCINLKGGGKQKRAWFKDFQSTFTKTTTINVIGFCAGIGNGHLWSQELFAFKQDRRRSLVTRRPRTQVTSTRSIYHHATFAQITREEKILSHRTALWVFEGDYGHVQKKWSPF